MEPQTHVVPLRRRYAAISFLTIGMAATVFGGLFSAATARSASYHSAWFVAYLVLVVGVAQIALGIGQWWLATKRLGIATVIVELLFFNVGNAGVIVGTLFTAPFWVDSGSALIVVALAFFGGRVWASRRRGAALWGYWALLVLLLVSVLVGLYFAHWGSR